MLQSNLKPSNHNANKRFLTMITPSFTRQDSTVTRPLEYNQLPWGDLIYGTKDQLRSLGVAVDTAFPGEEGEHRRRIAVTDPRGFKCHIEKCDYREEGVFCASIPLPGREQPEQPLESFAPGVLRQENTWTDDYVGTADALAAAGLILLEQLPGQPGMRKVIVTILPDGSLPKGRSSAKFHEDKEPGTKQITRASKTTFRVAVFVEADEKLRRYDVYARVRREWEGRMRLMPRPAPLHARLLKTKQNERMPAITKFRTIGNVIYLPGA
jgi:hypothetical protein